MNIAFTICSNNYLAHAKTLANSFVKYHPDFKFYIGLADKSSDKLPVGYLESIEVLEVQDLKIENLDELYRRFNITEFNTAIKPSYFKFFFSRKNANKVIYIDPDVLIKDRLYEVIDLLDEKNIIITPHILSPIDDEFSPTDYHTLRGGIFNLGFIALSDSDKVKSFLIWWHDRVIKYGFSNFSLNMFYDQLWINYVPAFFDNYVILKHMGYNMANWNLHERKLSLDNDNRYQINNEFPLRFFHFSGYKYYQPEIICVYQTRYDFNSRKDLIEIFEEYNKLLLKNEVDYISTLTVHNYPKMINKTEVKSIYNSVIYRLSTALKILLKGYV